MATTTALGSDPPPLAIPDRPKSWPLVEQLRAAWADPAARPALLGGAAGAALLGALFAPNLRHFAQVWASDANYSHGFLVPPIALYFANEAARRGPVAAGGGVATGLTLLIAAIVGRLATTLVPLGFVGDLSFLIGLAGLVALLAGGAALRRYAFPLAFLAFMVPLPVALYTSIATPLQLLVSRVAADLLTLTGLPVLREGNTMTLPGGLTMFVAEACSGMRQLTGFLALTTAVAFFTTRPAWYRATLVASAVPVALTANVARVVLTGWIMSYDPAYAEGAFHTAEGLLMMGLGLGMLQLECLALDAIARAVGGGAPR